MEKEIKRKNIRMGKEVAEWYEKKANEMGVTQSNLMVMALASYMTQQQSVGMIEFYRKVMEEKEKETT